MESSPSANTLGLEFNNLSIKDADAKSPEPASESSAIDVQSPSSEQPEPDSASKDSKDGREKKKPYVNPDRFKTGGTQR
ncbi:hypothetical protein MPER_12436, partial [Moniliophthora perniciosa FA553]